MKLSCSVIRDLLPLYAEDLACEDSRVLVEEHLPECADCQKALHDLREERPFPVSVDTLPLNFVRQLLRRHTVAWCILVGCLVATVALCLFGRLTEAEGVTYTKSAFQSSKNADGLLYVTVTGRGPTDVSYRAEYFRDENDEECMVITGYTSPWLRAVGKDPTGLKFVARSPDVKRIYYCDQTNGGHMTLLAGPSYLRGSVNGAILARLVLNYYLLAAAFLSVLFAVLWLCLRKGAAGSTLLCVTAAFVCYALAHFAIKGLDGATYFLLQDLTFILLTTATLFGIFWSVRRLLQLRKDW